MTGAAQRLAGLAGAALLAAVVALDVAVHRRSAPPLPPRVGSYSALAGSSGSGALGRRTTCGEVVGPHTEGVAHPVLPCGARLYLTYGGRTVLTEVIDRGPAVPGRAFDLTPALAARLHLAGVRRVRWGYAGAS